MLYKPGVIKEDEPEFLFDVGIFNEDINIREVAAIQGFYEKHGYIPESHIFTFLNWVIYSARKNVSNKLQDITKSSFAGCCSLAQSFFDQILTKLGFKKMTFNIGNVLGTERIHALTCVEIPTKRNGENASMLFMLDPTFRQFCIAEENRFERYNEEARWAVRMSTPHPGYFFNLTDNGRKFAEDLIHYGFFEINEDSLKSYFDPFALYTTPKEAYTAQNQVGMISSTTATGTYYWHRMIESREKAFTNSSAFDLSTPREIVSREDRKFFNRFRNRGSQSELDAMFEEQIIKNSVPSTNLNNSAK